jgi:hypothetical protein
VTSLSKVVLCYFQRWQKGVEAVEGVGTYAAKEGIL